MGNKQSPYPPLACTASATKCCLKGRRRLWGVCSCINCAQLLGLFGQGFGFYYFWAYILFYFDAYLLLASYSYSCVCVCVLAPCNIYDINSQSEKRGRVCGAVSWPSVKVFL